MILETLHSNFNCVKRPRTSKVDLTTAIMLTTKIPARITSEPESEKLMAETYCSELSFHREIICDRQLVKIRRRMQRLRQRDAEIIERTERIRKKAQELADSPVNRDLSTAQNTLYMPICETGCKESESFFQMNNSDIASAKNTEIAKVGNEMSASSLGQFIAIENNDMHIIEASSEDSVSTCNVSLMQNEEDVEKRESEAGREMAPQRRPSKQHVLPYLYNDSVLEESNMASNTETAGNGQCATMLNWIQSEESLTEKCHEYHFYMCMYGYYIQ